MESKVSIKSKEIQEQIEVSAYQYQNNEFILFENFDDFVTHLKVQPTPDNQIITYLQAHPDYQATWSVYLHENSGVRALAQNHLFLTWLREYFVNQTLLPSVEKIYEWLFRRWFGFQHGRLEKAGLLKSYEGGFIEHCWVYTHAVAMKLKELGTENVDFADEFADETVLTQWNRFFSGEMQTCLIAQSCPWQINQENQLSLYHPEIISYFANLTSYDLKEYWHLPFIQGDEGIELLSELLDREVFTSDSNQLNYFVADILTGDIQKNNFFRLIFLSTRSEKFARIAANAITVLNSAGVSFSAMNLSNIKISNAYLPRANFYDTNLEGADLNGSNLIGANIALANLSNADLGNVNFGQRPYWSAKNYDYIKSFAVSRSGKYIGIATDPRFEVFSYNNEKFETIFAEENEKITTLEVVLFSPDEKIVVTANHNNVYLWSVNEAKGLIELNIKINYQYILDVKHFLTIAESSEMMAIFNGENIIEIIDLKSYSPLKRLYLANKQATCVLFNTNNQLLVGNMDGYIYFYDISAGIPYENFFCGEQIVAITLSSSNQKSLAVGHKNGGITLVDFLKKSICQKWQGHVGPVKRIVFSPDGLYLASASGDVTIKLWDIKTGKIFSIFHEHTHMVIDLAFKKYDNKYLILSASFDGTVCFWNALARQIHRNLIGHDDIVMQVIFRQDSKSLISCSQDQTIRLWGKKTGELNKILQGYWDGIEVINIVVDPFGKLCAAMSKDGRILLLDIDSGEIIKIIRLNSNPENIDSISIAFLPNGKILVSLIFFSGCSRGNIYFWDTNTGRLLFFLRPLLPFTLRSQRVFCAGFTLDAKFLMIGTGQCIYILDINQNKFLPRIAKNDLMICTAFSSDENYMAFGSGKNIAMLNLKKRELEDKEFVGHSATVYSIDFNSDGKYLATGDGYEQYGDRNIRSGNTVRLWSVSTRNCLRVLSIFNERVNSVKFSTKHSYLAIGSFDKSVYMFKCPKDLKSDKKLKLLWRTHDHLLTDGVNISGAKLSEQNQRLLNQHKREIKYAGSPEGLDELSKGHSFVS